MSTTLSVVVLLLALRLMFIALFEETGMATRNTPTLGVFGRLRSALLILGEGLLLVFLGCLFVAWFWIADAIVSAPQPEERCFTTAYGNDYCREQRLWSIE